MLREEGTTDFAPYAPGAGNKPLQADFFVSDAILDRTATPLKRGYSGL